MTSHTPPRANDLPNSLVLLGVVVAFACMGLVYDGNWPKLLRIASAFAAYASMLTVRGTTGLPRFLVAGALAGAVSGVIRPHLDGGLIAMSVAGGAAFACVHRVAVTRWRALGASLLRS